MRLFWRRSQPAGHQRVRQLLSSYLDGQVSPQEREWTAAHLATCEACRGELEELRATVNLVRGLPQVTPPRSFTLAEAPPRGLGLPALSWAPPLATVTAAMLFALLVVGDVTGLIGPRSVPSAAPPVPAPTSEPGRSTTFEKVEGVQPMAAQEELTVQESTDVTGMGEEEPAMESEGAAPQAAAAIQAEEADSASPAATSEEAPPLEEAEAQEELIAEEEQVSVPANAAPSAPQVDEAGEPLLHVPLLSWLQGLAGVLVLGLGTWWLLRRRKAWR